MMFPSNPGVLDHLIRDRQEQLRTRRGEPKHSARRGIRVRLGRALIVAGTSLSGEQVERPARHSASPRAA
ncbi:MAG TPA: hypothetical protein VFW95_05490 [Candidatus Limnocylindria bacterium]|nr:hypothetical protein [Candidatus Limnocylindria bacterium]